MDKEEEMLMFSKILRFLEEERFAHLLTWVDRDRGLFQMKFMNLHNGKWDPSYLDVFKALEGNKYEKHEKKDPKGYLKKCKERFHSNMRKFQVEGKIRILGRPVKDETTGATISQYQLCNPEKLEDLMNLRRKRKRGPTSKVKDSREAKRRRLGVGSPASSPTHYSCLSVKSADSGYTTSESNGDEESLKESVLSQPLSSVNYVIVWVYSNGTDTNAALQPETNGATDEQTVRSVNLSERWKDPNVSYMDAALQPETNGATHEQTVRSVNLCEGWKDPNVSYMEAALQPETNGATHEQTVRSVNLCEGLKDPNVTYLNETLELQRETKCNKSPDLLNLSLDSLFFTSFDQKLYQELHDSLEESDVMILE